MTKFRCDLVSFADRFRGGLTEVERPDYVMPRRRNRNLVSRSNPHRCLRFNRRGGDRAFHARAPRRTNRIETR